MQIFKKPASYAISVLSLLRRILIVFYTKMLLVAKVWYVNLFQQQSGGRHSGGEGHLEAQLSCGELGELCYKQITINICVHT